MTGTFFAVVGASGVGKDTLIAHARQRLTDADRYYFPARYITRPPEAGGEDHIPLTNPQFTAILESGGFALSWRANGLSYGIPRDVGERLEEGVNVVCNLSRTVVDAARQQFAYTRVIAVTASREQLALRLADRGREAADAIAERLDRSALEVPGGSDVDLIDNDGDLDRAMARFMSVIAAHSAQAHTA